MEGKQPTSLTLTPRKDEQPLKPSDLPAPPQAALALMKACAQDDVSSQELAKLAAMDPLLSAELLRLVNSPFFGLATQVQSVAKAVTILGVRALRNLVLCLAVRDALRPEALTDFDAISYWESSLRRAVAARLLSQAAQLDSEECFTAGLLQDFGLLVLFHRYPERAKYWSEFVHLDPDSRYEAEQQYFQARHDAVAQQLAESWSLPPTLAFALGQHHHCPTGSEPEARLCQVLHCADWMAAVFATPDTAKVLAETQHQLAAAWNLSREDIDTLLTQIPGQVQTAGQALGFHIDQQEDLERILRETNLRLAEENLSYQELTWRLEETLRERDRLAAELERELALAREIQQGMMPAAPTGDLPIQGINLAARQLSGDFFDYFPLPQERFYFALGDVSGKGVNAAILMSKVSSLFRCLGKDLHDPGQLLTRINREMFETSTRGMFVSMIAGVLDTQAATIQLVNAGHLPALLIDASGNIRALEAQTMPLGIVPDLVFEPMTVSLDNSCMYLFTDGVTEGRLKDGSELGMDRLQRLLIKVHQLPMEQRLAALVKPFQENLAALRDDITLLLVDSRKAGSG